MGPQLDELGAQASSVRISKLVPYYGTQVLTKYILIDKQHNEKGIDPRCSGRLLRQFYLRLVLYTDNKYNETVRPNTLETKCICAQVGIITVPPREGAGRLGTNTSNGTLHLIQSHKFIPFHQDKQVKYSVPVMW